MSERYTEEARRAIFYAHIEASQLNSMMIGTGHLLLGLVRENTVLVNRFLITEASEDSLRNSISANVKRREEVSTDSLNMTFADESKRALSFAEEEAHRAGYKDVGIEHLLLGLLRDESSTASQMLSGRGANIERIRRELETDPYQPLSKDDGMHLVTDGIHGIFASAPDQPSLSPDETSSAMSRLEHYTEKARLTIFFARYEASQFRSPLVEAEHVLLGILREGIPRFDLFLPSAVTKETLRKQIEEYTAVREKVQVSPGLPLSEECERVLTNADEEAAKLKHKRVGLEHLMLGLLREEGSFAAQLLREHGAEIERIRRGLASRPPQLPPNPEDPSLPSSS
jgi:ATP-dependent Clp protease ATP-binding subunit ClpA